MVELKVMDMTCEHCVSTVTKALKAVDPVATVHVDLATKRVHVESRRSLAELTSALAQAGYPASV